MEFSRNKSLCSDKLWIVSFIDTQKGVLVYSGLINRLKWTEAVLTISSAFTLFIYIIFFIIDNLIEIVLSFENNNTNNNNKKIIIIVIIIIIIIIIINIMKFWN